LKAIRQAPFRSPRAISERFADLVKGKVFCDLGCAEGDNLTFFDRFAKEVIGIDSDKKRLSAAKKRGLRVRLADYFKDDIPIADVYYMWPDCPEQHFPLVKRLKKLKLTGILILVSELSWKGDKSHIVEDCARQFNGKVIDVAFNEGKKHRQSGVMRVGVIDL
jgi:hypothetical protein